MWHKIKEVAGENKGKFSFYHKTIREDLKIWVEPSGKVYGVAKSIHLGDLEFKVEIIDKWFDKALQAQKWAEQEFRNLLLKENA